MRFIKTNYKFMLTTTSKWAKLRIVKFCAAAIELDVYKVNTGIQERIYH